MVGSRIREGMKKKYKENRKLLRKMGVGPVRQYLGISPRKKVLSIDEIAMNLTKVYSDFDAGDVDSAKDRFYGQILNATIEPYPMRYFGYSFQKWRPPEGETGEYYLLSTTSIARLA